MDFVADVQCFDGTGHGKSDVYILVCMAADMEIPRNLLHSKTALDPTSILLLECFLSNLELSHLIGFPQQLEIP